MSYFIIQSFCEVLAASALLCRSHFCQVIVIGHFSCVNRANCVHNTRVRGRALFDWTADQDPGIVRCRYYSRSKVASTGIDNNIARIISVKNLVVPTKSCEERHIKFTEPIVNLSASNSSLVIAAAIVVAEKLGIVYLDCSVILQSILSRDALSRLKRYRCCSA